MDLDDFANLFDLFFKLGVLFSLYVFYAESARLKAELFALKMRMAKLEADDWEEETTYSVKNKPRQAPWKRKTRRFLRKTKEKLQKAWLVIQYEFKRIQAATQGWYRKYRDSRHPPASDE